MNLSRRRGIYFTSLCYKTFIILSIAFFLSYPTVA